MYKKYFKRFFDIVLSALALLVLTPLMLITGMLVHSELGSPVFFRQKRSGFHEKIFMIYKFRTMSDDRDKRGELRPDSERMTKLGKFLRDTSIDELPELINIFKGDMSFVGPRPLVEQYLDYYSVNERKRHSIRPGLSGWAQVNGRNSTTWESRFEYDLWYVENMGFLIDLKILFLTLFKVLKRENIGVRGVDSLMDFDVWRRRQMSRNNSSKENDK